MSRRRVFAAFATVGLVVGLVGSAVPSAVADAGTRPSAGPATLSAPQISALSKGVAQPVIVVFKDQVANLPATPALTGARESAVRAIQAPVVQELRQVKASDIQSLSLINAVSAKVTPAEQVQLRGDPAVSEVIPDATFNVGVPPASTTVSKIVARPTSGAAVSSNNTAACQPGKDGVELDPQALEAIRANSDLPHSAPTAASLGITGAGVKVAYMAEGIDINDPDFIRANGQHVFVDYKDFTGEGSTATTSGGEASLDSSSVAAQGRLIYTTTLPNGSKCSFRVLGAAPGASLVGLKVFPNNYDATTTALLLGINYAVTVDHVNVLNQSFGYNPLPDTAVDVIRIADEAAVKAGTTVVVSSGDAGLTGTVGSPSVDPGVISAGASTTYRVYAQEDIGGYTQVHATGWENDNLSGLSGAGFPEDLKAPNLLAPGDLNWTTCNNNPGQYDACVSGGTSEAAPLTSATAALVIQAYRQTHHGATPTPALIKEIITSTTTDLGMAADNQGSGLLDSYKAVRAAMSIKTSAGCPKPHGASVLTNVDEITGTAPVDTPVSQAVTLTNDSGHTQRVHVHGRILSTPATVVSTRWTDSGSWARTVKIQVPAGQSDLNVDLATQPTNTNGYIQVSLVDPAGHLALNSEPQGLTDTASVTVRQPKAGTWLAYTSYTDFSGTNGSSPADLVATVQHWQPFGQVTPATIKLGPEASGSVRVTMPTAAVAGDESASVVVDAGRREQTSIPVALRALVPLSHGTGTFSTTILGGNGRGGAPASTHFFAFDVPAGQHELNVATTYSDGPQNNYSLYLVSPQGEALGHASNQLVVGGTAAAPVTETVDGATTHVLAPAAGQWTLIVAFADPTAGLSALSTLDGTIDFNAVKVTAKDVPNSTKHVLSVGTPTVASVTITNTSSVPQSYFLDPRLDTSTSVALAPITAATDRSLPLVDPIPQWVVPTDTTTLTGMASATAGVTFDMSPYTGDDGGELNGDPQIGATPSGDTATATWSDNPITPGVWNIDPGLTGVFGPTPAPAATVNLSLTATTLGFNTDISTLYGDMWSNPQGAFAPVTVGPGQTTTLYAVITPSAAGSVSGTLFVDTATSLSPFGNAIPAGDQVAAVPYSYKATT